MRDGLCKGDDDAVLVAAIRHGAADAEARLCRRFVPRVVAYGLRHLGDRADAADLAQATLCVALEKIRAGEVDRPDQLASFVFGTCRNLARGWRRGDARRRAILERAAPVLDELARAETEHPTLDRARLASCVDGLSLRQRTVVMLTFYGEQDADEIGRALGMTRGNVRVVRHRALAALRSCLTGGGDPEAAS